MPETGIRVAAQPGNLTSDRVRMLWSKGESVLRASGVDKSSAYSIIAQVFTAAAGPVTLLLIASSLSTVVQGYYFTFTNLVGLQVVAELGLAQVIVQFASHEWAGLSNVDGTTKPQDKTAIQRLASLKRFAIHWYSSAGIATSCALGFVGFVLFSHRTTSFWWAGPWIAVSILIGSNVSLLGIQSLLEGCNHVSSVYSFRLLAACAQVCSLCLAIVLGAGLWSIPVGLFANLIVMLLLVRRNAPFLRSLNDAEGVLKIYWRHEILPMQWRIGVSFLSGYFIAQALTPLLFYFNGPVAAAQMGMTMTAANCCLLGLYIIKPRLPLVGALIARRDYITLDRLYIRLSTIVVAVGLGGALLVLMVVGWLRISNSPYGLKILEPVPAIMILSGSLLRNISTLQGMYLRAHKREPLMTVSLIVAGAMLLGTCSVAPRFSAPGVAAIFLAVTALIEIPCVTRVFIKSRREWHMTSANGTRW